MLMALKRAGCDASLNSSLEHVNHLNIMQSAVHSRSLEPRQRMNAVQSWRWTYWQWSRPELQNAGHEIYFRFFAVSVVVLSSLSCAVVCVPVWIILLCCCNNCQVCDDIIILHLSYLAYPHYVITVHTYGLQSVVVLDAIVFKVCLSDVPACLLSLSLNILFWCVCTCDVLVFAYSCLTVIWPVMSCSIDWSKRGHVTSTIIKWWTSRAAAKGHGGVINI